jgi:hypothetical protein
MFLRVRLAVLLAGPARTFQKVAAVLLQSAYELSLLGPPAEPLKSNGGTRDNRSARGNMSSALSSPTRPALPGVGSPLPAVEGNGAAARELFSPPSPHTPTTLTPQEGLACFEAYLISVRARGQTGEPLRAWDHLSVPRALPLHSPLYAPDTPFLSKKKNGSSSLLFVAWISTDHKSLFFVAVCVVVVLLLLLLLFLFLCDVCVVCLHSWRCALFDVWQHAPVPLPMVMLWARFLLATTSDDDGSAAAVWVPSVALRSSSSSSSNSSSSSSSLGGDRIGSGDSNSERAPSAAAGRALLAALVMMCSAPPQCPGRRHSLLRSAFLI